MKSVYKIITGALSYVTFSIACAGTLYQGDLVKPRLANATNYSVLDASTYYQTVTASRLKLSRIMHSLQAYRHLNDNVEMAFIVQQFTDTPYIYSGAMGEGDWQANSFNYCAGAVHIDQDPVYRLDGLDCQTFVQTAMTLLYANNLAQYDKTFLQIAYGAAGNPNGEVVHYYNRNNFIDGDWNPVNEQHGRLTDVTASGELASYAKTLTANITRQNWFNAQEQNPAANVAVLADKNGSAMVKRFLTLYGDLHFPHFDNQEMTVSYLPKEKLALPQANGTYLPNQALLAKIPTPAVVEIIRDPKQWYVHGKTIQSVIGTELTVSHLGFLYRQTFKRGAVIYQKIACKLDTQNQKVCSVKPVVCEQNECRKLMFAHATDSHPDGYYWYQQADKSFTCSATLPSQVKHFTRCNRVNALPLFDYLTDYQYGTYWYMNNPGLLGIHVEKIN